MTFYRLADLARLGVAPEGTSGARPAIQGERIDVSFYQYPANTKKKPHSHPEEQIVVVLKGRLGYRVQDREKVLGPGEAVHIPAGVEHQNWSLDQEVDFISCQNIIK